MSVSQAGRLLYTDHIFRLIALVLNPHRFQKGLGERKVTWVYKSIIYFVLILSSILKHVIDHFVIRQ